MSLYFQQNPILWIPFQGIGCDNLYFYERIKLLNYCTVNADWLEDQFTLSLACTFDGFCWNPGGLKKQQRAIIYRYHTPPTDRHKNWFPASQKEKEKEASSRDDVSHLALDTASNHTGNVFVSTGREAVEIKVEGTFLIFSFQ